MILKKNYIFLFACFTLLLCELSFSQNNIDTNQSVTEINFLKKFKQIDTSYIYKYPSTFVFAIRNTSWMDTYNFILDESTNILLNSDLSFNQGLSVGYKTILLSYCINLSELFSVEELKQLKWDVRIATNKFGIDFFYFSNNGNTRIYGFENKNLVKPLNESFDGLNSKISGANIYYFLNNKKYSNAAAFHDSHIYKQNKSIGSFIAGISFTSHYITVDFDLIPKISDFDRFRKLNIQTNYYHTYCASLGYGYNYVFRKKWLANFTFIPSIGLKSDQIGHHDINLTLWGNFKVALVYNTDRFYYSVNSQYNTNLYYANDYLISNSLGLFNAIFGVRI